MDNHFKASMIKSGMRILAGILLMEGSPNHIIALGGLILIFAEFIGIIEEFV